MADERLTVRDLRCALDVVRTLNDDRHEDRHDVELSAHAVATLGRLVGSDMTACAHAERGTGRMLGLIADPPEHTPPNHPRLCALAQQHPGLGAYPTNHLLMGASIALSDVAAQRELRRISLYTGAGQPHGMTDQLLCVVHANSRQTTLLSLVRFQSGFSIATER